MKKIAVYTAITGNYDTLETPSVVPNNIDFIAFIDDETNISSKVWQIRRIPNSNLDNIRKCRQIKTQPHVFLSEYDYSIWVDGNINITENLNKLIENLFSNSQNFIKFYSFKHPTREDVYEEARACIESSKDNKKIILKQVNRYRKEGYPKNNGMLETNVIIRYHNDSSTKKVMDAWWKEILNESRRDQLSVNYIFWKYNYKYGLLEGNSRGTSEYFTLKRHKRSFSDYLKSLTSRIFPE